MSSRRLTKSVREVKALSYQLMAQADAVTRAKYFPILREQWRSFFASTSYAKDAYINYTYNRLYAYAVQPDYVYGGKKGMLYVLDVRTGIMDVLSVDNASTLPEIRTYIKELLANFKTTKKVNCYVSNLD